MVDLSFTIYEIFASEITSVFDHESEDNCQAGEKRDLPHSTTIKKNVKTLTLKMKVMVKE